MPDGSLADIYMDTDTVRARLRALENLMVAVLARDPAHARVLLDEQSDGGGLPPEEALMLTERRMWLTKAAYPEGILGAEDHDALALRDGLTIEVLTR